MANPFLKGLNKKSLVISVFVVFAYIWISDFLIHGVLLKNMYGMTQHLWRTELEMQGYFPFMLLGQFLLAKFFTIIFAKGYDGKGLEEGLRFGLLMGTFAIAPNFVMYAVQPMPSTILWAWVGLGLVQFTGAGVVASLVYKKR